MGLLGLLACDLLRTDPSLACSGLMPTVCNYPRAQEQSTKYEFRKGVKSAD